jgi:hypothetical protein
MVFVSVNLHVYGQEGSIRGKVIDSETGKVVEYANVLNYSIQKSIYSNANGEFKLDARQGDTLVFYAVGYYYQKLIVNDTMLDTQHVTIFPLKIQVYELAEARIIGFGSYDDFKQQFIDLNQPKTKTDKLNESLAELSRNAAVEAYNKAKVAQGGSIVSVSILTPEEKERLKLAEITKKERIRDQIYQKFNPRVIKTVTGLSNDDEIIEFMVYCNFSDNYLLEVSEYDLMTRIALKYEMFKRKKLDEKSMKNPVNCIDDPVNSMA